MPRSKNKIAYRERAKLLRKFGYKIAYGRRGHFKASDKAAVSKRWKSVEHYVENTKQDFIWQPSKGEEMTGVRAGLSRKQLTPSGFFLRKAKGTRGKPTLKRKRKNVLEYRATGRKGGKVIETIHRIDPEMLMEDPPKAILALGKPGDKVILTVNGFDSSQTIEYSLQALAFYLALDLLPKFLDPNLDPAYTRVHGKRTGTKRQKLNTFTDIFHVKVIRHIRAKKKESHGKNKKGKKDRGRRLGNRSVQRRKNRN